MRVYIAGPLTQGDNFHNIHAALNTAQLLLETGHFPFVPHLTALWDIVIPNAYETWIAYDLGWLAACDCVLRLPGHSPGADRELAAAERLNIPIYHSFEELTNGTRKTL